MSQDIVNIWENLTVRVQKVSHVLGIFQIFLFLVKFVIRGYEIQMLFMVHVQDYFNIQ